MKKNEKRLFTLSCAAALLFAVPSSASAMHIMEGYLPIGHAVAWGALCLPFLAAGLISIKRTVAQHRKALLILAMAGAYAFVLSALKIPSVTGSSSHPTGTGLGDGTTDFSEAEVRDLGMICIFTKAGFTCEEIRQYLALDGTKDGAERQVRMLRKKRGELLERIHCEQKLLDKIDYIIREKKNGDF